MKFRRTKLALIGIGLALMAPAAGVAEDNDNNRAEGSSEQWWQWALSIPPNVNPLADKNGRDCMVGQRGPVWFLGGILFGGAVERTCTVPEGKTLFFPVVNSINFDTPNVCGQGASLTIRELRAASAAFINGITNVKVELDGRPVHQLKRIQSEVFEVALPENNIFDEPCVSGGLGGVPAGIYSPSVDDGIYVTLDPLRVGTHILRFRAENKQDFKLEVTYKLKVVDVSRR